jgi:hypothetical protein
MQYPEQEPLFFFRAGSAIPFESRQSGPLEGYSDSVHVLIIPIPAELTQSTVFHVYEDDGLSEMQDGSYNCFEFVQHKLGDTSMQLSITMKSQAHNAPKPRTLVLSLPPGYGFYDSPAGASTNSECTMKLFSNGQTESVRIVQLPDSWSSALI